MNLIFLGPPGAGKGTMAARAAKDLEIPHISTGDLFRSAVKNRTELGQRVQQIMDRGELVPDDLTVALVRERLSAGDAKAGYILDGFPRTIVQAEALERMSSIDRVVNFSLSDEEVVRRLSGRRTCGQCGKTFHIEFMPPAREGICDACGSGLSIRPDDTEESVRNRLSVYSRQTEPLIGYYRERDLLSDLDAAPAPDQVYLQLKDLLDRIG